MSKPESGTKRKAVTDAAEVKTKKTRKEYLLVEANETLPLFSGRAFNKEALRDIRDALWQRSEKLAALAEKHREATIRFTKAWNTMTPGDPRLDRAAAASRSAADAYYKILEELVSLAGDRRAFLDQGEATRKDC